MRISSWNFVRVPKAWLWAHVQSFSLKFASQVLFLQYTNFERIFWRAREMLVKQPPGNISWASVLVVDYTTTNVERVSHLLLLEAAQAIKDGDIHANGKFLEHCMFSAITIDKPILYCHCKLYVLYETKISMGNANLSIWINTWILRVQYNMCIKHA